MDHPDQLTSLNTFKEIAGFGPDIYFKIDSGYHRAGIPPTVRELGALIDAAVEAEDEHELCTIRGLYSHAGHSYGGISAADGMTHLLTELRGLEQAGRILKQITGSSYYPTLTVGATPSATSVQNLFSLDPSIAGSELAASIRTLLQDLQRQYYEIELHAGVYPFLDLQQIHTQASPSPDLITRLEEKDIAISILTEVASIYPYRNPPEALIAAGTLALGREPCPGYSGWGVVSDWGLEQGDGVVGTGKKRSGWEVAKISQEHGILRAKGGPASQIAENELMPWKVGQTVRIWPNHACVAGAGFPFYAVVDSEIDRGTRVVDIWVRCNGW